jgi:NAD(P) transhydrogenase subunit beta
MPVVVSLLNSYAGLAAAATGFAIGNNVLIIAGALNGASGFLLSILMSKAMNRSFGNVIFGAFGGEAAAAAAVSATGLTVRSVSPEDAAVQLAYASRVIVRWRRRSMWSRNLPNRSRSAAATSSTPSIRSPGECLAT